MTDRFHIVKQSPNVPRQAFYDNESDAAAALLDIRKGQPDPELYVLVRVREDEKTREVVQLDVTADVVAPGG